MTKAKTKKCTGCGSVLPIDRFFKDKNRPDGLRNRCKECISQYIGTLKPNKYPGKYQKEKIGSVLREMSEVQAALDQCRARLDFLRETLDESITGKQRKLYSEPVTFRFGTLQYIEGKAEITLNPELAVEMEGKP